MYDKMMLIAKSPVFDIVVFMCKNRILRTWNGWMKVESQSRWTVKLLIHTLYMTCY